jgi:serine/threonine-protein phosphatase PP1 catalytic subunit
MWTFSEDVFEEFLRVNGLEMMVRGYSVVEGGFKWWFGERLLSLYSAVGYCGGEDVGAVGVVKDGELFTFTG